ncbi:hypothetical protein CDL12_09896 [Handroanthus impetiginosus]|uniref:Uncharacterized protein n=1 Tax=Handroanthus impetiginosus TaxID=429701 RepID=A0A2G9HIS9_9LAMI|nr:hypothetical protein CDL12_09896 [Handroanthus impetiginosus]
MEKGEKTKRDREESGLASGMKMRNTIIDFLPRLLYSRSNTDLGSREDAFDIAMEGVLRRFKRQKMADRGQRLV